MGGKKVSNNESMLIRCIKKPCRILCKARDIYIEKMLDCAGTPSYPAGAVPNLPKSYSTKSSSSTRMSDIGDEDYRELIRAASQRGLKNKININTEFPSTNTNSINPQLPRSFTVGIGRIDEDKALDFDENIQVNTESIYPRSKSYAVSSKKSTNTFFS